MGTKIEWCDETWNPVTGCSPTSAGCANCYARRMATRLAGRCGYPAKEPFRVMVHPERFEQPDRWWMPRRIFVCSMGDLFHEDVPFETVSSIFGVMCGHRHHHKFLILTKRPERIHLWMQWLRGEWESGRAPNADIESGLSYGAWQGLRTGGVDHIWLGVSAEDQHVAEERIPILLGRGWPGPRFVSCEPLLEPIDLSQWLWPDGLNWVICGGETGPGARWMDPKWARVLLDQCRDWEVPFFFKQMSGRVAIPDDLMVREWPKGMEVER